MRGRVPSFSADAGRRSQVGFPAVFRPLPPYSLILPFLRLISSPSRSVSPSAPFLCGEEAISETFIPLRRARYSDRTFLHGFGAIRTRFRFPPVGNIRFPRPSTSESVSPHNIFRNAPPFCRARFLLRFASGPRRFSLPFPVRFRAPFSVPFFAPFPSVPQPRFAPRSPFLFHSRFPSLFSLRF